MQARNFITNVSKILDLKSSSEDIFRKLTLGSPEIICAWLWGSIGLKITDSRSPVMLTGQILFSPEKQCYRAKRIKRPVKMTGTTRVKSTIRPDIVRVDRPLF